MYSSQELENDYEKESTSINSDLYSSDCLSCSYPSVASLPPPFTWMGNFAETLLSIEWEQSIKLCKLTFNESNIAYVYNPIEYAFETHANYVRKYCLGPKHVLFLGMNPGPFGMAQNGVCFQLILNIIKFINILI